MIGSPSENATRNGISRSVNVFQAARFASDAGSSGRYGTSPGIARGAALYISFGNGAS